MERWLRIRENDRGEWSILDFERAYRICSFNHVRHKGVHLHHEGTWQSVDIENLADALQIVREYAKENESFDPEAFEEVLKRWKSEPSRD